MASQDSRVLFSYVPTGVEVPTNRDSNTIYFSVDEKQIYVGADLISKDYASEIQALIDAQINIVITGSGNTVSDASYDSSTHTLTLTLSNLPTPPAYTIDEIEPPTSGSSATYKLLKDGVAEGDAIEIPEYTIVKTVSPDIGYSATYQLMQNNTQMGAKINIPKDMVIESGSVVDITYADSKLYDVTVFTTAYIVSGSTPLSAGWLSLTDGGAALTPEEGVVYKVATVGDYKDKMYNWDAVNTTYVLNTVGTDVTELIKGEGGTATAEDAGKYIKLVIANSNDDTLYIAAKALVDIYTVEPNASEVQLAISNNNVISAVLVTGGIDTTKIADDAVTADKVSIAAHSETQSAGADGLALSVTTTDGQVSGVSGSIAANTYDAYGSAAAAIATWTVVS